MGASQSTPSSSPQSKPPEKPSTMEAQACPIPSPVNAAVATPSNSTNKPKPCCVCKEEKSKRDECMLFSNAKDPAADCKSLVEQYRSCMTGYGFQV